MRERPVPIAIVAIVAAVIGGISVLVVGKAAGWLSTGTKKTVVVQTPAVAQAVATPKAAVSSNAKPLVGNGFNPSRIYSTRAPGVVTIYAIYGDSASAQEAQGSGFVVSPKGYILTNSHVITNAGEGSGKVGAADQLFVEFQDRDRIAAKVVGWDIYDDVGLIKVNPADHQLNPVPLGDSAQVKVGEPVAAIGSPFGNVNSLSVGVVSATERSIDSLTSQYKGVGFAVPIDSARRSMTQLIAAGRVSYAYVGIETEDLIPTIAKRLHYPVSHGAVVTKVNPGTPGAEAGLQAGTVSRQLLGAPFISGGDVIVSIAGHPVGSAEDVVRVVTEQLFPGQSVPVTFFRAGRRHQVTLKLAQRPASPG